MTDQIPVKALRTGSTVTALAEFAAGDTINADYLPAASAGTSFSFDSIANGAISAETVAAIDASGVHNPDLTNPADVQKIIGITSNAAASGAAVTVLTVGTLTEGGWSWVPGPIYCAASGGALTQTAPSTGAVVQVATAISATKIQVGIRPAILRST
jgi:hypothetical protein